MFTTETCLSIIFCRLHGCNEVPGLRRFALDNRAKDEVTEDDFGARNEKTDSV